MPILSSTENCQPQQAIETGRKTPEINDQETNYEECHDNVCEEETSQGSFSRSSNGASTGKRKYVPTPANRKKSRRKTESPLTERKVTMNTLKTKAWDTFSKEILDFLKEESQSKLLEMMHF